MNTQNEHPLNHIIMKFKTYDLLSEYLLGEDGSVLEVSTGELMKITPLKNYLLQTDETVGTGTYRLKRRFTVDEVIKMFNSPKAVPYKEPVKVKFDVETLEEVEATGELPIPPYFVIDGKTYSSARKAGKELGISVNTVLKRCKANVNGCFYIDK